MTDEQTDRLKLAADLIQDVLRQKGAISFKVLSLWLDVAGRQCDKVAKEIKERREIKNER